jgi:hypothetical protein
MSHQLLRRFAQDLILAPQNPNLTLSAAQVLAQLGKTSNEITTT